MTHHKKELGEKEWEYLGLEEEIETDQPAFSLSWETLLPLLSGGTQETQMNRASRLGIVCIEALNDLDAAARYLTGGDAKTDTPDIHCRNWLIYQVAMAKRSIDLFETWSKSALEVTEESDRDRLKLDAAVSRSFAFDTMDPLPADPSPWESSGQSGRLGYQILLCLHQKWEELASVVDNTSTVSKLFAAHLFGDRLGQRQKQAEYLQQAKEEPILAAETLLELCIRGEGAEKLGSALKRRYAALHGSSSFVPEAAATAVLLQLEPSSEGMDIERSSLEPDDAAAAWRHLNALIARLGQAKVKEELAHLYLEEVHSASPTLAQILKLRAAEILMGEDDWGEAQRALPNELSSPVLGALVQQYRVLCFCQLNEWDKLTKELIQFSEEATERDDAARYLHLATLCAMREPDSSQQMLPRIQRSFSKAEQPGLCCLSSALMSAYRICGAKDGIAGLWSRLAEMTQEPNESAFFTFGYGVAQLQDAKVDQALMAFQREILAGANDPLSLAGLAIALSVKRRWGDVVETLSNLAEVVDAPAAVQLLREAAYTAVGKVEDASLGLRIIQQALKRCPKDIDLLQEAAILQLRVRRYKEASDNLERAAEVLQNNSTLAANLLCAAGKILQERVADLESAEGVYKKALDIHPLHPGSLNGLYKLLLKLRRYQDLPEILHSLLQFAHTDTARLKLLLELASLHRKLWETHKKQDDAESCIRYCDQALELDENSEEAIKNLVSVCQDLGRWQDIIDRFDVSSTSLSALRGLCWALQETANWGKLALACRSLAEHSVSRRESRSAILRAGDIHREQLGDLKAAEDCYRWAIKRFKGAKALNRLSDLLRSQNKPAELAAVLGQSLEAVEPGARLEVHLELGRLHAGPLKNARVAIQHYEAVVELDSSNEEALRALEPLLEQEKNHVVLTRVLEKLLQRENGTPEALRLLLKLGGVYGELKDDGAKLRIASRLHNSFPDDEHAISFAEQVYRKQARYADLSELYDRRIHYLESQAASGAEIAELLQRKGQIELSNLGALAEATKSFTRVLELDPDNKQTLSLLERILSDAGDWQRLMAVYEKQANNLKSKKAQISALHRAARIAQHQLNDEAEAVRLYERIHALDPSDAESFSFLERKLERRNDYRRLVELLLDRAERVTSKQDEVECILRAASICEQIADVAMAQELYQRALGVNPSSGRALAALARIYESLESWNDFLDVTHREIKQETDPTAKALLYFKCGSVIETKYHKEDEAVQYYLKAIKTSSSCLPALHSLRDLFARHEDWKKVVETLEKESRLWSDNKGRADVLAQIAEIYASKLKDRGQALNYYRQAIETHPENMPAALALFEAYARQGNYKEAAVWGDVYARRVHRRGSQSQRADFFVQWADILQKVGRHKEAAEYLVRALEIRQGETEALYGLLNLCREAPECYDFAAVFNDLLKDASKREDTTASAILSTACGVLAEHRSDIDTAFELYEQTLKKAGDQIRLARPMADLLVLLGREPEAVELVQRCMYQAREERFNEWIEAVLWLVDYELVWNEDFDKAAELCRNTLKEQPNRDDVRLRLARAETLLNRSDRAQIEYQRICDQLARRGSDPKTLSERHHALGLVARRAGDSELARASWQKACELTPDHPYPFVALARLHMESGDPQAAQRELAQAQSALAEEHPDVLRAQAEFLFKQGQKERSVELYQQVVSLTEASDEDRIILSRRLLESGDPEQSIKLCRESMQKGISYLPAAEQLERAWTAAGKTHLSRRANQVVCLAAGEDAQHKPQPMVQGPIHKNFWNQVMEDLAKNPVDELWRILNKGIDRYYQVDAPSTVLTSRPEIQMATAQMSALFGTKLDVVRLNESGQFVQMIGNRLILSDEAETLNAMEARSLLAMVLTAVKTGYGLLLRFTPEDRLELGKKLAAILARKSSPGMLELLASLSRREQRQVARHVAKYSGNADNPLVPGELARSWLENIEGICVRVTLLLTEDLSSLAKVLGLQAGIPADWLKLGGLLEVIPSMNSIVEYYLSDDFQRMRLVLQD